MVYASISVVKTRGLIVEKCSSKRLTTLLLMLKKFDPRPIQVSGRCNEADLGCAIIILFAR
jgi:hypothetical protein